MRGLAPLVVMGSLAISACSGSSGGPAPVVSTPTPHRLSPDRPTSSVRDPRSVCTASTDSGALLAVWADALSGTDRGLHMQFAVRRPGEPWTPARRAFVAAEPLLLVGTAGPEFLLVMLEPGTRTLFAATFDGTDWSPRARLGTAMPRHVRPMVQAVAVDGGYVIAWRIGSELRVTHRGDVGWTAPELVTDRSGADFRLATTGPSTLLAWCDEITNSVEARRHDGMTWGPRTTLFNSSRGFALASDGVGFAIGTVDGVDFRVARVQLGLIETDTLASGVATYALHGWDGHYAALWTSGGQPATVATRPTASGSWTAGATIPGSEGGYGFAMTGDAGARLVTFTKIDGRTKLWASHDSGSGWSQAFSVGTDDPMVTQPVFASAFVDATTAVVFWTETADWPRSQLFARAFIGGAWQAATPGGTDTTREPLASDGLATRPVANADGGYSTIALGADGGTMPQLHERAWNGAWSPARALWTSPPMPETYDSNPRLVPHADGRLRVLRGRGYLSYPSGVAPVVEHALTTNVAAPGSGAFDADTDLAASVFGFEAATTRDGADTAVVYRPNVFSVALAESHAGWSSRMIGGAIDPVTLPRIAASTTSFATVYGSYFTSPGPIGSPLGFVNLSIFERGQNVQGRAFDVGSHTALVGHGAGGFAFVHEEGERLELDVFDGMLWTRWATLDDDSGGDLRDIAIASDGACVGVAWIRGETLRVAAFDGSAVLFDEALASTPFLATSNVELEVGATSGWVAAWDEAGDVRAAVLTDDGTAALTDLETSADTAHSPCLLAHAGAVDVYWIRDTLAGASIERARRDANGWTPRAPVVRDREEIADFDAVDDGGLPSFTWVEIADTWVLRRLPD